MGFAFLLSVAVANHYTIIFSGPNCEVCFFWVLFQEFRKSVKSVNSGSPEFVSSSLDIPDLLLINYTIYSLCNVAFSVMPELYPLFLLNL